MPTLTKRQLRSIDFQKKQPQVAIIHKPVVTAKYARPSSSIICEENCSPVRKWCNNDIINNRPNGLTGVHYINNKIYVQIEVMRNDPQYIHVPK